MNFKLGEINIICTDVEASLRFYRDVLGFTPTTDEEGFYHLQFGGNQSCCCRPPNQPNPLQIIPVCHNFRWI